MKYVYLVIGLLVAVGFLIYIVGLFLPAEHVAEGERLIAADLVAVAARIREVETQPRWRSGVKSIEVISRDGGAMTYREMGGHGPILYRLREVEPCRQFESIIADDSLPFGGRWQIALEPVESSARVRIREEGVVRAPVFRTLSRFVSGHETSLRGYLADLAASSPGSGLR